MAGEGRTLGALRLDAPPWSGAARQPVACAMLGAEGREPARLPVSVSATVRMQSPARDTGAAAPLASAPGPATPAAMPPDATREAGPQTPAQDLPADRRPPPDAPVPAGDPSEPAVPSAARAPTARGIGPAPATTPADPAFCTGSAPDGTR